MGLRDAAICRTSAWQISARTILPDIAPNATVADIYHGSGFFKRGGTGSRLGKRQL
jgi:hypothetical protein